MSAPDSSSGTPVNADPLVQRLKSELDSASQGGSLWIMGGVALCVLSSAVVAVVLVILFNLWFGSSGIGFIGWTIVGLLVCGGVVGLMLKKKPIVEPGALHYTQGVPAEGLEAGNFYEYPMIGPRMLVAGIRLANPTPNPAESHFYDRCALLLRQLAKRGEQMPTAQLLIGDDETPMMLEKVIRYLDKQNWVGASSDRSRIWLSSKAQVELRKLGIVRSAAEAGVE
ncbi:MAG: hypothetical protein ACTHM6_16645 [Tepidisphaeraceae bacterium]